METLFIQTFMVVLVMVYTFMGGIFCISQKQGKSFVASFDRAFALGSGLFLYGSSLNVIIYMALI
jgi:hypothetical protein